MAHHGFYSRESCRTVSFSGELRTERQCFGRVEKTGCSLVAHYPFPVTWNRNQIVVWLIYVTEESLQGSWMWDITVWETRPCTGEIMALKILFKTLFRWSSYLVSEHIILVLLLAVGSGVSYRGTFCCSAGNPCAAICHCWLCHCQPSLE